MQQSTHLPLSHSARTCTRTRAASRLKEVYALNEVYMLNARTLHRNKTPVEKRTYGALTFLFLALLGHAPKLEELLHEAIRVGRIEGRRQ